MNMQEFIRFLKLPVQTPMHDGLKRIIIKLILDNFGDWLHVDLQLIHLILQGQYSFQFIIFRS